jgi:hypothetical protein
VYGGPDAGDPSELFEPFDGLDLDTAPVLGINHRRHTIATTQPQATLSRVAHYLLNPPARVKHNSTVMMHRACSYAQQYDALQRPLYHHILRDQRF